MKKIFYSLTALLFVVSMTSANLDSDGYEVGDFAEDFKLKNIDGKMVSMSDYKDAKGIIVIFTCNTCPYAKIYEDRIIAINNKYAPQGYPVIAINPNDPVKQPGDNFAAMQNRSKSKGFTFPYLVDQTQEVTRTYGASRTPHVFLLDKTAGKYKVAYIGAIDNNHQNPDDVSEKYLENAIESLKSGKTVQKDFTKAIGCTIKWREA